MILALVAFLNQLCRSLEREPWGDRAQGGTYGGFCRKQYRRAAMSTQPSCASAGSFESEHEPGHQPRQSSGTDLFADKAFSSLRSWRRPRRPHPVDKVLQGGPCPCLRFTLPVRGSAGSESLRGQSAGSLFWLVPLPVGPRAQRLLSLAPRLASQRVRQEVPAGDNILSHPRPVLFARMAPLAVC